MIKFIHLKTLFQLDNIKNILASNWSNKSGWEIAKYLSLFEQDLKENVKYVAFISLLINEVTNVDNSSCICMHIYTSKDYSRKSYLLALHKMVEGCNVENIYNIFVSSLKSIVGI